MRIAAIYDIHGNLPALEAVLADAAAAGVDEVVVGGDVVPGPMPAEAVATLLEIGAPVHFIAGNGEREVLAALDGRVSAAVPERYRGTMRWVAGELPPEHVRLLRGWAPTFRTNGPGGSEVLFCHATPSSDTEIFTRVTPAELLTATFEAARAALVVCGHTHMQFDRKIGDTRVVNAGSVGMPFGPPGAYWLLLGGEPELRRTDYDLEAAARRVRATAYPQAEEFAATSILEPPSEDDTLAAFESARGRGSGV